MSYASVVDALATQLQSVTNFSSANVVKGDFSVLNRGVTRAIVLVYNRMTDEIVTQGGRAEIQWYIDLYLFNRYKSDTQIHDDAADDRWNIIDRIHQYPLLNNLSGTLVAEVVEGRASTDLLDVGGSLFSLEILTVRVTEDTTFTIQG